MEYLDALGLFMDEHDYTVRSAQWMEKELAAFEDWLAAQGVRQVDDIKAAHVRSYFKHLREKIGEHTGRPLSNATVVRSAGAVITFVRWLVSGGSRPPETMRNVRYPVREKTLKRVLTPEQIQALFRAAHHSADPAVRWRNVAILSLLQDTGMRAQELCGLRVQNIHLGREDSYVMVYGKGRKEREIGPLSRHTRTALSRWLHQWRGRVLRRWTPVEDRDIVFLACASGNIGGRLTVKGLNVILHRLAQQAGLPPGAPVDPHSFRHTYSYTYMLQPGADVMKLSRLLGHEHVGITEGYLQQFGSVQARMGSQSVLDALHPGSPLPRKGRKPGMPKPGTSAWYDTRSLDEQDEEEE